jgi:RNA polymerase sigma factor (sigma-70 family)
MSDLELLNQYAQENRQEAFAELLDRHLRLVYSAALRTVRSPQLAEEVAQSVFARLAQHARELEPQTVLTAWLYQITRHTAINVMRGESRRRLREQAALEMTTMNAYPSEWTVIEPLLDEAMEALEPQDRTAILLRYFEDKSLREVGQALGASEDAAQKRVSRALDHLRAFFSKRGRAIGVGGLAAVISAHAAQAAPASLKSAILSSAAISGAGAPMTGTIGITKTLAMTTLQKAIIVTTLAAAVGTASYEAQRASAFKERVQTLERQPVPAAGQIDTVRQQLDAANRQLAALQAENEKLRGDTADVYRLRGEVGRLRDAQALSAIDPTTPDAKLLQARIKQIKQRLQQTPGAEIPEFQYLTSMDWFQAAAQRELNTDKDYARTLGYLRNKAEDTFVNNALLPALKQFAQANNEQYPTDMNQLKPYFNPQVDDAILQRWEVVPGSDVSKTVSNWPIGCSLTTQIAAVDPDYDARYGVGPRFCHYSGGPNAWTSIDLVAAGSVGSLHFQKVTQASQK